MEERENMNCGNQVAENGRKKKLWQPSCGNLREEFKINKKLWQLCAKVVAQKMYFVNYFFSILSYFLSLRPL